MGQMFEVLGVPSLPGEAVLEEHHQQRRGLRFPPGPPVWGLGSVGLQNALMPTHQAAPHCPGKRARAVSGVVHTRDNATKTKRVMAPANYFTLNI